MTTPNPSIAIVQRIEIIISTLLRVGVVTSLAIIVVGMVITFIHHPTYFYSVPDLQEITADQTTFPHSIRDVGNGLMHFRGQAIVVLGLLLLIATPVLRVAVSIVAFLYAKDRRFALISAIVLALLLLSFLLGKVE